MQLNYRCWSKDVISFYSIADMMGGEPVFKRVQFKVRGELIIFEDFLKFISVIHKEFRQNVVNFCMLEIQRLATEPATCSVCRSMGSPNCKSLVRTERISA